MSNEGLGEVVVVVAKRISDTCQDGFEMIAPSPYPNRTLGWSLASAPPEFRPTDNRIRRLARVRSSTHSNLLRIRARSPVTKWNPWMMDGVYFPGHPMSSWRTRQFHGCTMAPINQYANQPYLIPGRQSGLGVSWIPSIRHVMDRRQEEGCAAIAFLAA